ncbi:MAG: TetR/AcrR family transcriptional regulator [Bacteroidia bacterium]
MPYFNEMEIVKKKKKTEGAEEKIIAAARHLFTERGYDAVKTRDIAKEAGINLALLNYYFRSKENLFEIIMQDNISQFMEVISEIVNNEDTSMQEKIENLVANYIDMFLLNPDMPLFVISNSRIDNHRMRMREKFMGSYFMKQVQKAAKKGKIADINPGHFMMNIVGLTIFPFVARRMLISNNGLSQIQFNELMQERKKMIPKWIEATLKVK